MPINSSLFFKYASCHIYVYAYTHTYISMHRHTHAGCRWVSCALMSCSAVEGTFAGGSLRWPAWVMASSWFWYACFDLIAPAVAKLQIGPTSPHPLHSPKVGHTVELVFIKKVASLEKKGGEHSSSHMFLSPSA